MAKVSRWTTYAKGSRKQRHGVMNTTEERFFAEVILPRQAAGRVVQWWFEAWSFRLTSATPNGKPGIRYTPDFVCLLDDGSLVVFEVKGGHAWQAGMNRTKLFADTFPMRVYVATVRRKKDGGGFQIEEF